MIPAIAVGVALSTIAFGGEVDKNSPLGLSLTIGVKQTDNRDAIGDDHVVLVRGVEERVEKEDDTELWITPTISLRHEMGDGSRFFISYSPSYTDYDNPRENGMENEWTHSLRADADHGVHRRRGRGRPARGGTADAPIAGGPGRPAAPSGRRAPPGR